MAPPKSGDILQGYTLQQCIGQGRFGVVFSSFHQDGREVALKIARSCSDANESLAEEAELLQKIGPHPHLVQFVENFTCMGRVCIALKKMKMTLYQYLSDNVSKCVFTPVTMGQNICRQILQGLLHLHKQGYLHGDVKPANILLHSEGPYPTEADVHVCLCDVGHSRCLSDRPLTSPPYTTFNYRSVESILHVRPYHQRDVWSAACCIFEVMCNYMPDPT